MKADIGELRR